MKDKFILDACCGGRMMWFNKNHPNALYIDFRELQPGEIKQRPNFHVKPDLIMDFRKMSFSDKSFRLVVFDPPHLTRLGHGSILYKKYGGLVPETWQRDLKLGFDECWRVLKDYGTLIFKWSDSNITYKKVLQVIKKQPLFHSTINKKGCTTYWACFMKIP